MSTKRNRGNALVTRILPVTAGTCLLVSMQPCQAAGGHGPHMQGGGGQHRLNQLRQNRISRFNATGMDGRRFDLDLTSIASSVVLGSKMFDGAAAVTIDVGGVAQTFAPGQQVTPAQYVAIQQVLSNTPQSLNLNSQGAAAGGSFSLNAAAQGKVGDLVVPENVTAVNSFSANRVVGFSGDITNNGSIYGVSTNGRIRSGVLAADDISNSGLISTDLTGSFLENMARAQKRVDLNINANGDFSNSGTVSSSGSLSIATGSGAVVNSGSLNARNGNLSITASNATALNIDGAGGSFSASGDINIRENSYKGTDATNLVGGDYFSQNLNIFGGNGAVYTEVGQLTGQLNTEGGMAHVYASTDVLTLGDNCIKGDPTYANATGDILINGAVVANEAISILASGNITATGNAYISTANSTGAAATPNTDITLIAGALVTNPGAQNAGTVPTGTDIGTGNQASVNFALPGVGGLGGNIDLSQSKWTGFIIDTSSNLVGSGNQQDNGGDVFLTASAFGGVGGLVLFPSGRPSIRTSSLFGNSGNVSIVAGGISTSSKTPAIRLGIINTQADNNQGGGDGDVLIMSAQPEATAGTVVTYDAVGNIVGAPQIEVNPANLIPLGGSIQLTGSVFAGDGGDVNIIQATGGAGGVSQLNTGRVQASNLTITAGLAGIGGGKGKGSRILTEVTNLLTLTTGGTIVLVNNLGSVTLNGGTTADLGIFDVTTTPDAQGNGRITIANNTTIKASAGTMDTINLTASEVFGGTGGIRDGGANTDLIATNVNLLDGADGLGTGDIGTGGNPIDTTTTNLSANAASNVFLVNAGPVTLLDSSAGNLSTFELGTTPVGNNGTITLDGDIQAAFGIIGTIDLDSSENPGGIGGIVPGGTIVARTVNLSDTDGGGFNGDGAAAIGLPDSPIIVEASILTVNTLGPSVNITNTISTGMTLGGSQSGLANGNSFQVTSSSGILVTGAVDTGTILNLISGGKGKSGGGYIIVGADLNTNLAGGTINLTAGGDITRRGGAGNVVLADNIVLTSTGGGVGTDLRSLTVQSFGGVTLNLTSNAVGYTNIYCDDGSDVNLLATTAKSQFTLTGDADITINPEITGATGIKIATTSGTGFINVLSNLGSAKTTGMIELDTAGTGVITTAAGVVLSALQTVSLSSDGGNIGSLLNPIQIAAPTFSANTLGGTGSVNLFSIGAKKTTAVLLNSASDGDFNITSGASLQLTTLLTTDGSINVNTSGTLLSTAPNAVIQIGEPGNKAPGARTITLLNSATKAGKGSSGILIGAGSKIQTFVNAPGVGIAGAGAIRFFTTTAPQQLNASPPAIPPANVVIGTQSGGGLTYFGTNGIIGLAPNNTIDNIGADVTFDTGNRPASAITLGGDVLIHADPPPLMPGMTPQTAVYPTGFFDGPPVPSQKMAPRSVDHIARILVSSSAQKSPVPEADSISVSSGFVSGQENSFAQFGSLASAVATTSEALASALRNQNQNVWISETELASGEIPAQVLSDNELGLSSNAIAELEIQDGEQSAENVHAIQNSTANGGTINSSRESVRNVKVLNLKRGVAVFAPTSDTYVNTSVGKIRLDAGSLALVMSFGGNVSVYDLDDAHKGSVEVTAAGKKIALSPGMHVSITRDSVREFADINPAQLIGYRSISDRHIGEGLKAFIAEFSIPHAINAVQPLKHLLDSKNPHSKRIAGHLLKTTAALMQMGGNRGNYEQVFRAQKTAYLR